MKYFLALLLFPLSLLRKWSPSDLAERVPAWNFLNDPEEMIPDKTLGPKVHSNYLKINHVYDKTDVNFFVISDIIEKYVYHKKQFVEDLYLAMENNTAIDAKSKKEHHLMIVMITKTKDLLILPSSDRLSKLIPEEKMLQIEMEIKKSMSNRQYAQSVYFTFEKLQQLWKKHTIKEKQSGYNKGYSKKGESSSFLMDLLYIVPSVAILGLFIFVCCCKKKQKFD